MSKNIPNEIYEHYKVIDEDNRLNIGDGILEFERSKEIISRYIKKDSLNILDIGGGTG